MLSFFKMTLLVAMVTLMMTWVCWETSASPLPLAPFQTGLQDRVRHDIITYAARIIKSAMSGESDGIQSKRNGGTLDTLYNLPDLSGIGRRR